MKLLIVLRWKNISKNCVKNIQKPPKIQLILDQESYNTSKETLKAAKKYGIILHYLPPYSPNLNSIEQLLFCISSRFEEGDLRRHGTKLPCRCSIGSMITSLNIFLLKLAHTTYQFLKYPPSKGGGYTAIFEILYYRPLVVTCTRPLSFIIMKDIFLQVL